MERYRQKQVEIQKAERLEQEDRLRKTKSKDELKFMESMNLYQKVGYIIYIYQSSSEHDLFYSVIYFILFYLGLQLSFLKTISFTNLILCIST